ncbi:MAG: hypothetical protein K2N94_14900 [Lachnospiraceae bacterium]|nr:hypothetical protein [Lachnospiraceae bacterium]
MRKKYILAAVMAAAAGLTACSFEPKEGNVDAGTTVGSPTIQTENAQTKPSNTDDMDAVSANADPANTDPANTNPANTNPVNTAPADSEQGTVSLAVYRQVVEKSEPGMVFSLIDLDEDENSELVAGDRGNDRYSIYTIKDGTVFCLVDSMAAADFTYFERSGIIATFASWNGGGDEGGYGWKYYQTSADKTLTDEDTPLLEYSYNAVYDEEGVYTGKGITVYFYMGQDTDETVYKGQMETLGIAEGSGRPCLESGVFAEEMLGLLK